MSQSFTHSVHELLTAKLMPQFWDIFSKCLYGAGTVPQFMTFL